jgi:hydroxylamine dehydrogenase
MRERSILNFLLIVLLPWVWAGELHGQEAETPCSISPKTKDCITCHSIYTPGIVEDWKTSRHAKQSPGKALETPTLQKRMSARQVQDGLREYAVGCYECHSLNPARHKDNFDHMGFRVNVIVTPDDCKTCHPDEAGQYLGSKKSHAYGNLMENPVYSTLVHSVTGLKRAEGGRITERQASPETLHETCLGCHGTKVEVTGMTEISAKIGKVKVPALSNWPNQGVGRINPDGSRGSCAACHVRHSFSIEMARKPYTCSQCHLDPDVPAWKVYEESKHGNIFLSKQFQWDFQNVPWTVGRDFKAPTCATCHISLITSPSGEVIAERNHDFGARLWVRIFGLIYSHPQPKSGDTTIIRNSDGLPLPSSFSGEPAKEYLIDSAEAERRFAKMKSVCGACHGSNWILSHFKKFDNTLLEVNQMTHEAMKVASESWGSNLEDRKNPFDEAIEQMWVKQWLFYSNSVRYASAMTGAPDYATFKNGWWYLTETLRQMVDRSELKKRMAEKEN